MQHFIIQSNNRSSKKIINLLNSLRKDIIQVPIREFEGNKIKLFVGDYKKATSSLVFSDFITLVRNNDLIKKLSNTNEPNVNLWNLSFFSDTNFERQEFLYQLSLSYISYKEGKFHDCIEILKRVVKKLSTTQTIPISIGLLEFIYKEKDIKSKNITEFVEKINHFGKSKYNLKKFCANIKSGPFKIDFTDKYTFQDLLDNIKCNIDNNEKKIITIHSSKGKEFDNVIIYLDGESQLKELFCTGKTLEDNENSRVFYVALSRAKNNLYLCIDNLSENSKKDILSKFDIEYTEV